MQHVCHEDPPLASRLHERGGLTSHGAIAAGLLYLVWAARRYGISVWTFADAFDWTNPIGNVFVRIGNFINGELYGNPTALPWGVRFPTSPDLPRQMADLTVCNF